MVWKGEYITGIVLVVFVVLIDAIFYLHTPWFIPLLIIALTIGWSPFWYSFFVRLQRQREIEAKFPEFVRNLVGAIKSGMPAPRALIHIATLDYGALTPHVRKLANQIEWSIPVHRALLTFANDTRSAVIKRAIASVIEAEMSGGALEDVLDSITNSVVEIKKIKQRRMAAIHSQVIQSYIIFLVFIGVMIIIQNLLVPYMVSLERTQAAAPGAFVLQTGFAALVREVHVDFSSFSRFVVTTTDWFTTLKGVFLMLALIQALFAGLVVGKLSEGMISAGVKHSLILMTIAFFIITLAQGYL